jgi:hypothetical protein
MKNKRLVVLSFAVLSFFALTSVALTSSANAGSGTTFVQTVRKATAPFQEVQAAEEAGYGLFHGCVSGPQGGAMGIHYVNGDLAGDGELDASHPEALMYEAKNGKLELVGVEYVVMAEAWDANHDTPPMLMGQLFNYVGSPNRYGLPAFYELHVWAWQSNPDGVFADFNPQVSCESYVALPAMQESHH